MQNTNTKLGDALREATSIDLAVLEEEMKGVEPHVFSDEFNKKMKKLLWRAKVNAAVENLKRYTAVAVFGLLLIGGIFWISGTETTSASKPGVDILAWLEEYFSFEKGDGGKKEEEALFLESQIGFIPEGFEKTGEVVSHITVKYEYANAANEYIILRVDRDKSSVQADSESVSKDTAVNAAGYEYTYVYDENNQGYRLLWEDSNGHYYSLDGSIEKEILIQIMDSINYER